MDAKQHDFFLWFETTFADLAESTGLNKFIREHPIPIPDGPDPSNPTPPVMEQDLMLELRDKVWNWVNEAHRSQDSNFVQIRREDLTKLVKASMKLEALEGGGVDNWVGYGEALFEDYGNGSIADEIKRPDFFDAYCTSYVVSC